MKSITALRALLGPTFAGACLLADLGCSRPNVPPPEAPLTAAIIEAPTPPKPVVMASPNVNVSPDLAEACKLQLGDVANAPKFDFDASTLGPDDDAILSQIAACVTTGPLKGRSLSLVGRADPRGPGAYNLALGGRRATSVNLFLSNRGVTSTQLVQSSRGELDATGTDEAGWTRDRRVDVILR